MPDRRFEYFVTWPCALGPAPDPQDFLAHATPHWRCRGCGRVFDGHNPPALCGCEEANRVG
jgi:rubrerythrin